MPIFDTFGIGQTILLGIVVIGLIAMFYGGRKNARLRQAVPGLMTSLGILGTFLGVVIALVPLDFSPEKMNESIAALLAGMTFAFVTSLLGLSSAIATKIWWSLTATAEEESPPEHQDIAKRLDAIKEAIVGDGDFTMLTQMQHLRGENRERLDAIEKGIVGDSDSSMASQMQRLRNENTDGFKKLDGLAEAIQNALVKNLEDLIKEIREVVGKQLGDSLRQLVESIEEALINQFGETFVQFNEAVQALKKWQEDHRDQVEKLTAAFDESAKGIEKIKDDCAKIPEAMDKIEPMISAAKGQLDELENRLGTFAEMKKQAEDAFPAISEKLEQICEDLRNSAAGFDGLGATIAGVVQNAEESSNNMRQNMEEVQKDATKNMATMVAGIGETFADQMNKEVDRMARQWGEYMVAIANKYADTMKVIEAMRAPENRGRPR